MNKERTYEELKRACMRKKVPIEPLLVEAVERKPFVMVSVQNKYTHKKGVGFAKCRPTDAYDENIGQSIAVFRAVEDLISS